MIEKRLSSSPITISREETSSETIVQGYAALFNHRSNLIAEDGKIFREVLNRAAFDSVLGDRESLNCICNVNHDDQLMLSRSKSGTLELFTDEMGLVYRFAMPKTTLGIDTAIMMERGDLSESSFRFSVKPSDIKWSRDPDGTLVREIMNITRLYDVAIVRNPAYNGTAVGIVRGLNEYLEQEEAARQEELQNYILNLKERVNGFKRTT